MNTPRTNRKTAEPIGFYSCATVPASFAADLEIENRALLDTLKQARSALAKAAITLEQYDSTGPIHAVMSMCNCMIKTAEEKANS